MHILDAARPAEREEWLALWHRWPDREVFAHPDFLTLFATRTGARAMAAVYADDSSLVIYPFALRTLVGNESTPPELQDVAEISTPYAYGGPFVYGNVAADSFWPAFDTWAREQRVATELIRFSLFPEQQLSYPGEREERLWSVVRSLTIEPDRIWADFDQKVRKNVSKAQRNGLRVVEDPTGDRFDDFFRILTSTLDRRTASRSAYFPREFFDAMHASLRGQFTYFHTLAGDAVVSSELVLLSARHIYSFLGGTDANSYALRPNDLLKYEIIRWGQAHAKQQFVLGAGFAGDDGIFRYKLSFAPHGVVPFFVGRRILRPDLNDL